MNKETSSHLSTIAGIIMNAEADGNETPADFARLLHDAKKLAGSALSQDETPGQHGIHPAPEEFSEYQVTIDPVLHFFHYSHLPEKLRATSRAFFLLAAHVINTVPRNAERTVALRKLLEAKDAAVRANLPAREIGEKPSLASATMPELGKGVEIGGHGEEPIPFDN